MDKIEYRVRPVTRYVVTRWYSETRGPKFGRTGSECLGEFDNEDAALRVMEGAVYLERHPIPALPLAEDGKSIRWTEGA